MASRLVLVLGDLFIPDRAPDIPAKFQKLLTPGKIGQVLCLGNLTGPSTYEYLRTLAPDLQCVRGSHDTDGALAGALPPSALPLSRVVQHGPLRIGLTHGFTLVPPADPDALLIAARHMDVDVLLWSGGAHRFEAYELEGKFFVNPGSATGAVGTGWLGEGEGLGEGGTEGSVPSFCLMDCQGDVLVLYVYQLREGEAGSVSVEKVSFRKGAGGVQGASAGAGQGGG